MSYEKEFADLVSDRREVIKGRGRLNAETFNIYLRSENSKDPIYLYGNEIKGNTFMVYFENFNGERTEYFKKIIKGVLEHSIFLNNECLSLIENIINAFEDSQHKHDSESEKSDILLYLNFVLILDFCSIKKLKTNKINTKEKIRFYYLIIILELKR